MLALEDSIWWDRLFSSIGKGRIFTCLIDYLALGTMVKTWLLLPSGSVRITVTFTHAALLVEVSL